MLGSRAFARRPTSKIAFAITHVPIRTMKTRDKATPEGTAKYFQKQQSQSNPVFNVVRPMKWSVTPMTVNCAEFERERLEGYEMLKKAITSGKCNVIETSGAYSVGYADECVNRVMHDLCVEDPSAREEIVVMSRVGQLRGSNLSIAKHKKSKGHGFQDVVELSDENWFCISPDYINFQISQTLENTGLNTIDVVMLHNPELLWEKVGKNKERFYGHLENSFDQLEKEVKSGRIQYYGVTSNALCYPSSNKTHISLHDLLKIADGVRPNSHHFRAVSYPMNILRAEPVLEKNNKGDTISLSQLAKDSSMFQMYTKPFTAVNPFGKIVTIDEVPTHEDKDLIQLFKEALDFTIYLEKDYPARDNPEMPHVKDVSWGQIITHNLDKLGNLYNWNAIRQHQIEPLLTNSLNTLTTSENSSYKDWAIKYRKATRLLFERYTWLLEASIGKAVEALKNQILLDCPQLVTKSTLHSQLLTILLSLDGDSIVVEPKTMEELKKWVLNFEADTKLERDRVIPLLEACKRYNRYFFEENAVVSAEDAKMIREAAAEPQQ